MSEKFVTIRGGTYESCEWPRLIEPGQVGAYTVIPSATMMRVDSLRVYGQSTKVGFDTIEFPEAEPLTHIHSDTLDGSELFNVDLMKKMDNESRTVRYAGSLRVVLRNQDVIPDEFHVVASGVFTLSEDVEEKEAVCGLHPCSMTVPLSFTTNESGDASVETKFPFRARLLRARLRTSAPRGTLLVTSLTIENRQYNIGSSVPIEVFANGAPVRSPVHAAGERIQLQVYRPGNFTGLHTFTVEYDITPRGACKSVLDQA
jgi:hypothetical protein